MPDQATVAGAAAIRPKPDFLKELERASGESVSSCYHCRKCTNGCPLAFAMDVLPNQVMRMIQLGLENEVLRSKTVWICASCQTCTTRCPNDIDIAHVMDVLRQWNLERGVPPGEAKVVKFHEAFLKSVRRHGRVFETGMVFGYKMATKDFFGDMGIAWQMFKRGKLQFVPDSIRGRGQVRAMFDKKRKG